MLMNIVLVMLTVMAAIFSAILYRKASNTSLSNLNMITVSFWILLMLCAFPSILIVTDAKFFLEFDPIIYGDFENRFKGWAIQIWMMLAIPIGAIVAKLVLFKNARTIQFFRTKNSINKMEIGCGFSATHLYFTLLLYFIVFLIQNYIFSNASNPLMVAVSGGSTVDILVSRNEFSSGSGITLLDKLFSNDSILILSLVAYSMSVKTKAAKWTFLFSCMFVALPCSDTNAYKRRTKVVLYRNQPCFLDVLLRTGPNDGSVVTRSE